MNPEPIAISVVICTYNRADSLRVTLESLCRQNLNLETGNLKLERDKSETGNRKPETGTLSPQVSAFSSQMTQVSGLSSQPLQWELLVVDNNSTDHTRPVCDEYACRLPLRYLFEPRQGHSAAKNRGVRESTGSILAFTDDDVEVDANWLKAIGDAAQAHPEASFFGGRVIPQWETAPPAWVTEHSQTFWLRGVLVHLDYGDKEVRFDNPDQAHMVYGANMAIRRGCFEQGLTFREDLGLTQHEPTRGEDTELLRSLMRNGHTGMHVPASIVHHRTSADRTTERYLREWYKGQGISEVRLGSVTANGATLFHAPRYLWLKLVRNACRYVSARLGGSPERWLPAEIEMARCWGWIVEMRRQNRPKPETGNRKPEEGKRSRTNLKTEA